MSTIAKNANADLNLEGKWSLCAGCTQGKQMKRNSLNLSWSINSAKQTGIGVSEPLSSFTIQVLDFFWQRGIADRLSQAGSSVVILGRNAEIGKTVIQELKSQAARPGQQQFDFVQADLS